MFLSLCMTKQFCPHLYSRKIVTRLSVSAKVLKHSEETIFIIQVKLCYKKNESLIGSGRFVTVTAGKIQI